MNRSKEIDKLLPKMLEVPDYAASVKRIEAETVRIMPRLDRLLATIGGMADPEQKETGLILVGWPNIIHMTFE